VNPAKDPEILSVTQLTAAIKYCLEQKFNALWVSGEISGLSRPHSGHVYFSLKDRSSTIKAVIWRSNAQRMEADFLKEGLQVICLGNLDVYGPRGVYQLNVRKIEPLGQGALQLAFRKLHARLESEGLFDPAHKKKLPRYPTRVAVVTSPTGAAVRDFLQVVNRRWANIEIIIVPVQVQGPGSAEQIENALAAIPDFAEPPDVVVLTRGGGSIEDLWSFNEERVCRAIFHCPIPVICGVGHEIDVTLADLVADVRALTPSEAAERLVPDRREVLELLAVGKRRLGLALKNRLTSAEQELALLAHRPVMMQPLERIRDHERQLDDLAKRIQQLMNRRVEDSHHLLGRVVAQLESLSPLSVLARGYSLTTTETGELLVNCKNVSLGDTIRTRLRDGQVVSRVEEVE
jgi:exodeoxyribonuclease VII large subunit